MSWHCVGPGRGPVPVFCAPIIVSNDAAGSNRAARRCLRRRRARVAPRAFTMLSSIGRIICGGRTWSLPKTFATNARLRARCIERPRCRPALGRASGRVEVVEDSRRG